MACAGAGYANHCEVNWVPRNLAVRVPESVSLEAAALTTIGAPKTADICSRAIVTSFPGGLPQTVEAVRSMAADFSEDILAKLEPSGPRALLYPHNLTDLLFAYVPAHPEEFGTLPKPDDA